MCPKVYVYVSRYGMSCGVILFICGLAVLHSMQLHNYLRGLPAILHLCHQGGTGVHVWLSYIKMEL